MRRALSLHFIQMAAFSEHESERANNCVRAAITTAYVRRVHRASVSRGSSLFFIQMAAFSESGVPSNKVYVVFGLV